jgi:outer membrane protein assembly factor BamB
VRWTFKALGAISGSPVVINDVVYFSTLKNRTYALDPRSGKLLWAFRRGAYGAVVSDRRRLYLVGYARVFGMAPRLPG